MHAWNYWFKNLLQLIPLELQQKTTHNVVVKFLSVLNDEIQTLIHIPGPSKGCQLVPLGSNCHLLEGSGIYIYMPGSSRYVKILPFHPKNIPKGRNFTYLEDPGVYIYIYEKKNIYIYEYIYIYLWKKIYIYIWEASVLRPPIFHKNSCFYTCFDDLLYVHNSVSHVYMNRT